MTTEPPHVSPPDVRAAAPTARFIVEKGEARRIADLVEPVLADLGFRLVRVQVSGDKGRTVQIMAERDDGSITIDDCEAISRQVSPVLDVADPISGAYRLEVSSPGIDRPLVRPSDFADWEGYEVKLQTAEPIDGRRRFKGIIAGFDNGEVLVECELADGTRAVLGFLPALITDAKLTLTDDLIREALTRAKRAKNGAAADGLELDDDAYETGTTETEEE